MADVQRPPSDAENERNLAEGRKFDAEAAHLAAQAAEAQHKAELARINLEREVEKRDRERHKDGYADRIYRFLSSVSESSVVACIDQLNAWHREDPDCQMMIVFDSPGGAVIPGFHLFDHILQLREDHQIDTVTRGYAASMGGILLQAGERRLMGPNATLMLHEVSFGAQGKITDVEDTVEFAKLLWDRALDIFAERCKGSGVERPLTRNQLARRSNRKNWWIKATDALKFGLVDAVQ